MLGVTSAGSEFTLPEIFNKGKLLTESLTLGALRLGAMPQPPGVVAMALSMYQVEDVVVADDGDGNGKAGCHRSITEDDVP